MDDALADLGAHTEADESDDAVDATTDVGEDVCDADEHKRCWSLT